MMKSRQGITKVAINLITTLSLNCINEEASVFSDKLLLGIPITSNDNSRKFHTATL